jgi:hypothetical protein
MLVNDGSSEDMSGMMDHFTSLIIEGIALVEIVSSGDRTFVVHRSRLSLIKDPAKGRWNIPNSGIWSFETAWAQYQ